MNKLQINMIIEAVRAQTPLALTIKGYARTSIIVSLQHHFSDSLCDSIKSVRKYGGANLEDVTESFMVNGMAINLVTGSIYDTFTKVHIQAPK